MQDKRPVSLQSESLRVCDSFISREFQFPDSIKTCLPTFTMENNKNVITSPYPDINPILNKELHEFIFERSQLYGDMTAFVSKQRGTKIVI